MFQFCRTLFYSLLQGFQDCLKLRIAAFRLDLGMPQTKMYANARQDYGRADRLCNVIAPPSFERI